MDVKIVVETKTQMQRLVDQLQALADQQILPEHRRSQWRLTVALPGRVDLEEKKGAGDPVYITTCDLSAEGVGFLSRYKFLEHQKLLINIETDLGDVEVPGVVIHCTGTVGMFKVGVRFDLA